MAREKAWGFDMLERTPEKWRRYLPDYPTPFWLYFVALMLGSVGLAVMAVFTVAAIVFGLALCLFAALIFALLWRRR